MVEKGITIRAIPMEIIEYWTIQDKHIPNCKNEIVYKNDKAFEKKVKIPENGGKFIIVSNCKNGCIVRFDNCKHFDSIEDAIKSIL